MPDSSFIDEMMEEKFMFVSREIERNFNFDMSDINRIKEILAKMVIKCQEIETPFRPKLEKLCFNYMVKVFGVPQDSVKMTLELKDNVNLDDFSVKLDASDGDDYISHDEFSMYEDIDNEVHKRRILDCLSVGAGMEISGQIINYYNDVIEIDERLPEMYERIMLLNEYILFQEDVELTDEDKKQGGMVELKLGAPEDKPIITAQGTIFPILLSETIRGFFELFFSHGLPSERSLAERVIGKADFLKAEPWDMRIGPILFNLINSHYFDEIQSADIPYVMSYLSRVRTNSFLKHMRNALSGNDDGLRFMKLIVSKSKMEDNSDSVKKMRVVDTDKTVITDEKEN